MEDPNPFEEFQQKDVNPYLKHRAEQFGRRLAYATEVYARLAAAEAEAAEMEWKRPDRPDETPLPRRLIRTAGGALVKVGSWMMGEDDISDGSEQIVIVEQEQLPAHRYVVLDPEALGQEIDDEVIEGGEFDDGE